ncbi:YidB family protein [Methylobacter sp.]|uniref:YidB family protein n=1 Tax=Methylobacter sp. TaxID=2051955 RepID=UPI003520E7FA
MSFFTDIVKSVIGANDSSAQTENKTQNLLNGALGMLEKMGGVDGLVKKFQQSGMGDVASSWVGTGENKSIQPDQLANVLGKDQVAELAQQAGIPESQGASVLSQVLPAMVDKLTPEGKAPESSNLATWGKVLLGAAGAAGAAVVGKAAASYFGNKEDEEQSPISGQQATNASAAVAETGMGSAATSVRTYTVSSGDTLSKIAKQFYSDANQWPRIFDANRDILNNPDRISPGQHLRIP